MIGSTLKLSKLQAETTSKSITALSTKKSFQDLTFELLNPKEEMYRTASVED
jgi:hypothetical protein